MIISAQNSAPPLLYRRPKLYDKQELAFFNGARISLCEASTKAGKTHAGISWLIEYAFTDGAPGRNYWWIAPIYAQAKIVFGRLKRALPPVLYRKNEADLTITLANGAVIQCKSGENPDGLYGDDVHAAVIDEASRMREESFYAVRSTLTATRGPLRCIGNVKGRKNWFYLLCRRAQSGDPGFHYEKITAYDAVAAGVLDAQEIEDAKSLLPERVFRELYLAEPSDDGGNPFGIKNIENCYRPNQPRGVSEAFGADLAKSFDWTVLCGLDGHGVQSDLERWQGPLAAATARIAAKVGARKCAIDATGLGVMPAEILQKTGDNFLPYTFTQKSKQILLESLVVGVQRGEIIITDETTQAEMIEFEYEYTRTGVKYTAPPGYHDDCVIALALANYAKGSNIATWGIA